VHRRALTLVLLAALLGSCGGGDDSDSETRTTAVGRGDCEMTAASARRVQDLLLGLAAPSLSDAGMVLHERKGDGEAATSTDASPDGQRDIFVLINEQKAGVLGLKGTTGSRSVSLTARPGCGSIGFVLHETPYRAVFTLDGEEDGSVEPQKKR